MATPKTLTLTDDRTQKAYELYGKAKVDAAIAKQAGVGQVVKAPSIGTAQKIVKNTDGSSTTTTTGTGPVTTTTGARSTFDANAAKVDTLTNGGVVSTVTDKNGNVTTTYKDGRVETKASTKNSVGSAGNVIYKTDKETKTDVPAPVDTSKDTPYTTALRTVQEAQAAREKELQDDKAKRQTLYDDYIEKSDENHKQLLNSIKTQFDQIRDKTTDSNSRFNAITNQNQYLVNGFRYTPQQSYGIAYDAEQQGLARIAAIDSQYSNALLAAATAKDEHDYEALQGLMDDLDSISQERMTALQDMATNAKSIQDSLATVENMNENQVSAMNNMMEGFGIDLEGVASEDRDEWYEEKAKELSEVTGTKISGAYVKSQMSRYDEKARQAKIAPDPNMSAMRGVWSNAKGEPILTADGKQIRYSPNDSVTVNQATGQMTIQGIDAYGNPTIKNVDIPGWKAPAVSAAASSTSYAGYSGVTSVSSNLYTGSMSGLIDASDGTLIPTTNPKYKNMNNGGMQCGEYVNRITGTNYGDTLEQKKSIAREQTGGVGSTVVIDVGNTIGHVGIIMEDLGNAWKVKSSNYHLDGRVSTDIIPKSKAVGYYTPESVKNANSTYSDSDIELLAELANMDASARNTALKAQGIPLKAVTDYMAAAKAGQIPPSEAQKQSSVQIMSQIQDLVSTDWNDATGFQINPFFSIGGTDRATAEGKIASLIAAITLPNLGMLKGPMSDKDLAFIQNASTRLNTKQSDKEFEKQLIELYNIGARKNGMKEITKLSEIPTDRILAGQSTTPETTGASGTEGDITFTVVEE